MPRLPPKTSSLHHVSPRSLIRFGQHLEESARSVKRNRLSFDLLRGGAKLSRGGALIPTPKQIRALRRGHEQLKKSRTNLFTKAGALAFADNLYMGPGNVGTKIIHAILGGGKTKVLELSDELEKAGRHWSARELRAIMGGRTKVLELSDELEKAGSHWSANQLRVLLGRKQDALRYLNYVDRAGDRREASHIRVLMILIHFAKKIASFDGSINHGVRKGSIKNP